MSGADAAQKSSSARRPVRNATFEVAFGQRIRVARIAAGLSQTALGQAIGVSFQQIQKYELGKDRIAVGTLQRLADTLGIHPGSFFDEFPTPAGRSRDIREVMTVAATLQDIANQTVRHRLSQLIALLAEGDDG